MVWSALADACDVVEPDYVSTFSCLISISEVFRSPSLVLILVIWWSSSMMSDSCFSV